MQQRAERADQTARVVGMSVTVARPSLDDVYLKHAGQRIEAEVAA